MKSIIKVFFSFIITTIALFLFSCKKGNNTAAAEFSLSFSDKALEYVQLAEGRFRIYKDSATSLTDSVIVTKSKLETIYTPRVSSYITPSYNHEQFSLALSKYAGTSVTEWFNGTAVLVASTMPFITSDTEALQLFDQANIPVFYCTETTQSNLSMSVEGINYNNVILTVNDTGVDINHPAYKLTAYYWAKGVGIIKCRTISTGGAIKTYTLVRYN